MWLTGKRWEARGGRRRTWSDIAIWAVPFGIVGGRLYHVITDPELYFKAGEQPIRALYIWDGGLGIWGAVALGGVGAWIGCRRKGIRLSAFADALAPGLVLAQAIGRWGNYFNQELYGRPTGPALGACASTPRTGPPSTPDARLLPADLPVRVDLGPGRGRCCCSGSTAVAACTAGRLFALYVAAYTAGRGWVEALRDDHANHILGLRLNDWVSLIVFLGAAGLPRWPPAPGPPREPDRPRTQAAPVDVAEQSEVQA